MDDQCFYRSCPSQEKYRSCTGQEKLKFFTCKQTHSDLDSALNELGMLSTITSSRLEYLKEQQLDYLKEKMRKKCSHSHSLTSAPLCVVHMNSDFVTQFSLSKNNPPECKLTEESLLKSVTTESLKQSHTTRHKGPLSQVKRKIFAPYQVNWRVRRKREKYHHLCKDVVKHHHEEEPVVKDGGNKSNPSSPVKSQNSCVTSAVGCSIFRSRSLDDLEIGKSNDLNEDHGGEIDTVSQRISKLHVS